jgi:hypothetical protein
VAGTPSRAHPSRDLRQKPATLTGRCGPELAAWSARSNGFEAARAIAIARALDARSKPSARRGVVGNAPVWSIRGWRTWHVARGHRASKVASVTAFAIAWAARNNCRRDRRRRWLPELSTFYLAEDVSNGESGWWGPSFAVRTALARRRAGQRSPHSQSWVWDAEISTGVRKRAGRAQSPKRSVFLLRPPIVTPRSETRTGCALRRSRREHRDGSESAFNDSAGPGLQPGVPSPPRPTEPRTLARSATATQCCSAAGIGLASRAPYRGGCARDASRDSTRTSVGAAAYNRDRDPQLAAAGWVAAVARRPRQSGEFRSA